MQINCFVANLILFVAFISNVFEGIKYLRFKKQFHNTSQNERSYLDEINLEGDSGTVLFNSFPKVVCGIMVSLLFLSVCIGSISMYWVNYMVLCSVVLYW